MHAQLKVSGELFFFRNVPNIYLFLNENACMIVLKHFNVSIENESIKLKSFINTFSSDN